MPVMLVKLFLMPVMLVIPMRNLRKKGVIPNPLDLDPGFYWLDNHAFFAIVY